MKASIRGRIDLALPVRVTSFELIGDRTPFMRTDVMTLEIRGPFVGRRGDQSLWDEIEPEALASLLKGFEGQDPARSGIRSRLAAPRLHGRLDPRGGGHHLPFMGVLGDDSSQDHMAGRYGWQGSGQGLEGRWKVSVDLIGSPHRTH